MKTRIIASIITFAFIFTQCGIGWTLPIYKGIGQNLRTDPVEGGGSAVPIMTTEMQQGNPAAAVGVANAVNEVPGELLSAAARETVLVVDDEPSVLGVTKAILESKSYTVIVAENAEQALQILAQPNDITLIVSDNDMPGISGTELSVRVNVPFLLITGGASSRPDGLRPDAGFLNKPFGVQLLLSAVEALLKPVAEPPAAAEAPYTVEQYEITLQPNGDIQVKDTTSGQSKTVSIEELRNTFTGRAIVIVDDNKTNREALVGILKQMQIFEEIADTNTRDAAYVVAELKNKYSSVFVLNNTFVRPAVDGVEDLAIIDLRITTFDEANNRVVTNAVYSRLAIFV